MAARRLYLSPPIAELQETFLGRRLEDISTPAAVVDRAIVRRNCSQMLEACAALDVAFRPHIKTYKVGSLTRINSIHSAPMSVYAATIVQNASPEFS